MPQFIHNPAIQEPSEIPPIIKACVIKTEAAQFGINPIKAVINGSKKPVEDIKDEIASSPINSTIQPKAKLNNTIKTNIFNE